MTLRVNLDFIKAFKYLRGSNIDTSIRVFLGTKGRLMGTEL